MRRTSSVLLALALVACGGGTTQVVGETTTPRGLPACPNAGELRLGRICWSPVGSRWHMTAMAPGGEYAFDVELLAANRLRSTDHPGAGPVSDEWFVDGNTLRMFLSDRFVEYRADVSNGTVMVGHAENVRGDTWEWRGDRLPATGACEEGTADLGDVCFAIAGTRWTLSEGGSTRVIHFAAEGRVLADDAPPAEGDTWTQDGASVTFTLGGRSHTATVSGDGARLSGDGWSAERLELYAPPMH